MSPTMLGNNAPARRRRRRNRFSPANLNGAFLWLRGDLGVTTIADPTFVDPVDFSSANWNKFNCTVANVSGTVYRITEAGGFGQHGVAASYSPFTAGPVVKLSCKMKYEDRQYGLLYEQNGGAGAWFDLENGILGSIDGNTLDSSMTALGDGWYLCSMWAAAASSASCLIHMAETDGLYSYAPAGRTILVDTAEIEYIDDIPVTAWANQVAGATDSVTQAVATRQPVFKPLDSEAGARDALHFNGAKQLVSTRPAADWAFLHDGTGCTIASVVVPKTGSGRFTIAGTQTSQSSTFVGAITTVEITTDDNYWLISNGTNWVPPIGTSANDPGKCMIVNTYETGGTPNDIITRIDGSVTRSVDEANSPTSADPTTTLYINQLVAGANAKVAELFIADRVLSSAELSQLEGYFAGRYGL